MSLEENDDVSPTDHFAIGISFGNSNSSIAHTNTEGKAEVIANEEGDRQIPSILSYVKGEEYHGTQAKSQLVRNAENTIAYFRDFIGKDLDSIDPTPCHASAHPQKQDSTVAFTIKDADTEDSSTINVSDVVTRHLRRLASSASDFLGQKVNAAVITVPTDFSDEQKAALTLSAKQAGLEVLQYILEPVAAVLAYDARPESKLEDKIIAVADLGGIRSDIAIIASRGGLYSILATVHDYESGGRQLDQVLVDHFAKEFVKKHKSDPRQSPRSLAKLSLESEATKKALSLGATASLSIESLAEGIDFSSTINRTRYELLASKVFAGFMRLVQEAIQKADLDVLDINEVILSGGTSHTPRIASLLSTLFPPTTTILSPSTLSTALSPSTLAARGAAIQASLIQEYDAEDITQSTHPMVTVTPHLKRAIGILLVSEDEQRGLFVPLLAAETPVPVRRAGIFETPRTGGDVLVKVCEGVRQIRVEKKVNDAKTSKGSATAGSGSDLDDSEDDQEDEEVREKVWSVGSVLAEASIRGVKKGAKIEVTVNVGGDLNVSITAREVGGKGGVRGTLNQTPPTLQNGTAG